MAKKLRVGDSIRGYRVTKIFGPGMMAISYASDGPGGVKVFLKQYKSPSPAVIWYPQFVEYQQELSRRVRDGKAARYAVRLVDAFEEIWGGRTYFAAFELVENARDLEHMLEEERDIHRRTKVPPTRDPAVWARHVTWAKVFMAGIAALHESKIVHADLKPANALLIRDPSLSAGYELKLIDMDFSLLADRKAPWHGYQAYIGTDNYRSPEHMTRGAIPTAASDIFTSGLILYELLVGVHPYWHEDQAEYAKRVRAYDIKPPALLGLMPAPADNAEVSAILHRCLSPDPAARPTASEIRAALSGRAPKTVTLPASTGTATGTPARPAAGGTGGTRPDRSRAAAAVAGRQVDVEQDSAGDVRWPVPASRDSHRDRKGRSSPLRCGRGVLGRQAVHRRAAAGRSVDRYAGAGHGERDSSQRRPADYVTTIERWRRAGRGA